MNPIAKLDLSKSDKTYYSATRTPALVRLDPLSYLFIVDRGAPDSLMFANATEALYSVAYGVKGICKKENRDGTQTGRSLVGRIRETCA
jgi:hypothetical protein